LLNKRIITQNSSSLDPQTMCLLVAAFSYDL
jgi:hypothetical protein